METTQACNKKPSPPTPQERAKLEYPSKCGVVAIGDERWMRPIFIHHSLGNNFAYLSKGSDGYSDDQDHDRARWILSDNFFGVLWAVV